MPWCSSFINYVMGAAGHIGTRSKAAQSWRNWGEAAAGPVYGAICVLARYDFNTTTNSWESCRATSHFMTELLSI